MSDQPKPAASKKPARSRPSIRPEGIELPKPVAKRVSMDSLHLDPANARLHNARNLTAIKASLKEYGQVEPILTMKSSGKIIGGNGRYEAMRSLGWTECDIAELDIDNTQATALAIVLNRTAELAEWDDSVLASQLDSLLDEGMDAKLLGFSQKEMDKLLEGLKEGPDDAEEADSELGDTLTYSVVVDFATEEAQIECLQKLEAEGCKCRLLIT